MTNEQHAEMVVFLEDQQAAITGLFLQAYQAAGGHYAALEHAQRLAQAQNDSREFVAGLQRGTPDRAALDQTARSTPDPAIVADIVRMTGTLETLFQAFVQDRLAGRPALARELAQRSSFVIGRFRLSLSSALINRMVSSFSGDGLSNKPPPRS